MAADLVVDSLDTDILVLGAGGAGLCAALHAADRAPRLTVTVAVKGLLGRAGCTRMVQGGYNAVLAAPDSIDAHLLDTLAGRGVDQRSGAGVDPGPRGARPRARAGGPLRLLLRPPPGRADPPEALRGAEPRPHHPQGRPHRHRDHEPPDRAGLAAPVHPPARGAPRGGAAPRRRRPRGRGAAARRAPRHLRGGAQPRHPARDGRRAHHVQGHRVLGRQVLRRHRARPARGRAPARHGDGAVPPDRAHRAQLAHDRRAARGGPARGGRPAAERPRRAIHAALRRRAPRAVHPRPGGARLLHRGAGGPRHRQRRRVDRRVAPGRRGGREELPGHGARAAATSAATSRASRSRWGRPPTS